MLNKFCKREIERIVFCCTKSGEPQLKALGVKFQIIPQMKLDALLTKFITMCKRRTQDEFWEWRTEIHRLLDNYYYDERMNVRQPMSMQRAVWSLQEIDYECNPKLSDNMRLFLERIHEETLRPYPPYLTEAVKDEPEKKEKLERAYESMVEEGRRKIMSEKQALLKVRQLQRKSTMDEMIANNKTADKAAMRKL